MALSSDPDADAVLASFDHPEAATDSDAASVLATYDKPAKKGSTLYREPTADEAAVYKAHPELAPGWTPPEGAARRTISTLGDIASGANAAVVDAVGAPMDLATNASNLLKSGAEAAYLATGNTPPTFLDPDKPENVPGTSAYLKRKIHDAGYGKYIEPNDSATNPDAAGLHAAGEVLGPIPFSAGLGGTIDALTASKAAPTDAQAALDAAYSSQSMGAAAAAPRLRELSPDLQEGVRKAVQQTGGAVPAETLTRHVEADSLPVKIRLTEGQATQDPRIISQEMNNRGATTGMVERLNEQNQQLIDNVRELRDRIGPDVFTTNPVDHGASLIEAYKAKDAPIKADISAKYKALEDANGGAFPLDTEAFVKSTDAALSKALKSNSIPSDLAATLNEFRSGGRRMTFEDFESLRSDAADAARTASDGRQRAAAAIIRDQLEKMPLTPEATKLKPLADAARSAAKARFDALDADPAYEAAVHGTVPEDRFVQRFITGPSATRNGVAIMRQNLEDNPVAIQTMGVATLDHLRQAAGIDPMGNGNFGQASFNKALVALDPKLQSLVDPKTAEHLSTLGNVARYVQNQPRGSYVNNSNTLVGALASHAAGLAEKAGNVAGGGLIPLGTMARESLAKRAAQKAAAKSLAPGAGLTRLSDLAK